MVLKKTLAWMFSRVMSPKELLDLYTETYAIVETGLPLHDARIIKQIKLKYDAEDTIDVTLLEGEGIPALTPYANENKRIIHQFFYNGNEWYEVGHEMEHYTPNAYIPNYYLQIMGNDVYPIECPYPTSGDTRFDKPFFKEKQIRYGITIPTNIPEEYVFRTLEEKMKGYSKYMYGHDQIFLIFQKESEVDKVREELGKYDTFRVV